MKSNLYKYRFNVKRTLLVVILTVLSLIIFFTSKVYATGGKNKTCSDAQVTSIENGSENQMSYSVTGGLIEGVCIKSGVNMFEEGHSGSLGNGDYEDGCYTVSGIGTSTVTVNRNKDGKYCQGLSHLDVYTSDIKDNLEDEDEKEEEESGKGGVPENEDSSSDDDNSDKDSSSDDNSGDSNGESATGGVLGASTQVLAATGSAELVVAIVIMLASGAYLKALLKKKALC